MGSKPSTSKTKNVTHPDTIVPIVPLPPPDAKPSTTVLPPRRSDGAGKPPDSRLQDDPLPTGWQIAEVLTPEEAKAQWDTHHAIASRSSSKVAERHIKRAPTRISLNVLQAWEMTDFDLSPGDVVMGRYTVQGALDGPERAFEVVDAEDRSACVLKVQPPTSANEVLRSMATHEAIQQYEADRKSFLHHKDAFFSPETGNWAVVVEEERSNLRRFLMTGTASGDSVVRHIGTIATAALNALDRLHRACFLHTDINLDNIVLDANGNWKLGGLENAKALPKGGGGVAPRNAKSRQFRPPEVLLGCRHDEASDIFDLGMALLQAAAGTDLVKAVETTAAPSLLVEVDAYMSLHGALPQSLIDRSHDKKMVCTPEGGFLRPAKRGTAPIFEVAKPHHSKLSETVSYMLEQGRLAGKASELIQMREFLQKLLQAEPERRPSAAEALKDRFLVNLAKGGKMRRASINMSNADSIKSNNGLSEVADDEEVQNLLKEGEGELALLTSGLPATNEADEPIDTTSRLSVAKVDVKSHIAPPASKGQHVKFKSTDDIGRCVSGSSSTLTMLPGTVEEEEAKASPKTGPRLNRQQTGFVKPTATVDEEDEESEEEEEKHVNLEGVAEPKGKKILRQKTKFERGM